MTRSIAELHGATAANENIAPAAPRRPRHLTMYPASPQGAIITADGERVYFFDLGMAWQALEQLVDPRICAVADARPV